METKTFLSPQEYVERVNALYEDIRAWCEEAGLSVQEGDALTIEEEDVEDYQAPTLNVFSKKGRRLASMIPIGLKIIGAEGRVDLRGLLGSKPFLLFTQHGGPRKLGIQIIEDVETDYSKPPFKRVEEPGWYWLGDWKRKRAIKLHRDLFLKLM